MALIIQYQISKTLIKESKYHHYMGAIGYASVSYESIIHCMSMISKEMEEDVTGRNTWNMRPLYLILSKRKRCK
jgi:hypothetical protein